MHNFLRVIFSSRKLIWSMSIRDLKSRYAGTFGGLAWTVIHPLVMIVVYWLVFSVGFKAVGPNGISFTTYFLPAFIAWTFFSEALSSGTVSIIGRPHLINKMVFPTELLPLISVLSTLQIHLLMLSIAYIFLSIDQGYTYQINLSWMAYGLLCQIVLSLGLTWLLSALNVFFRDVQHFLTSVLHFWFWLTPIVWDTSILPIKLLTYIQYNPLFYITEIYRMALVPNFPERIGVFDTFIFWTAALCLIFFGTHIFLRLKSEFADEL